MFTEWRATNRRISALITDSRNEFDEWWRSKSGDENPDHERIAREAWLRGTQYRLGQELFEQRRVNSVLVFVVVLWIGLIVAAIFN